MNLNQQWIMCLNKIWYISLLKTTIFILLNLKKNNLKNNFTI